MFCTDGSPHAKAALHFGSMIVRHSPRILILIHSLYGHCIADSQTTRTPE